MTLLARTRLMQMTSQAFPIGGYSHSFGLEAAVECGLVRGEADVNQWIDDVLSFQMESYEVPVLLDMSDAWSARDAVALRRLNEHFLCTRESAELRSATVQMGHSMTALLEVLPELPDFLLSTLRSIPEPALPCAWSGAADAWGIPESDAAAAYLYSWAENQVLVAMKSVPIGQSSGQRILLTIGAHIAQLVTRLSETRRSYATGRFDTAGVSAPNGGCAPSGGHVSNAGCAADYDAVPNDSFALDRGSAVHCSTRSNFAPGLAILCSQHETQYSRLFRS